MCKRAQVALATPPDVPATIPWTRVLGWLFVVAMLAALGFSRVKPRAVEEVQLAPMIVEARAALVAPPDAIRTEPPLKTPEEQLAEAERARLEREHQEADAKSEVAQPSAADELRDRAERRRQEEDARDRARHEAVKKELEALSVSGARRDVVITMYSNPACGVCTLARNYMREKNIAFSEFDVDQDEAARTQARALNPRGTVPTISVDGDIMIGFAPLWLEHRIERAAKARANHR